MSRKRRDKDPVPVMPQRYTWNAAVKFDDFEGADTYRKEYTPPSGCKVKVKRRKNHFEVRLGTPI